MWRQGLRFLLVGLLNTWVGFSVILALQYLMHLGPMQANVGGYLAGGTVSYLLNRRFTFHSVRSHRTALPRFMLAAGLCFMLNLFMLLFCGKGLRWPWWLAQALAVLTYNGSFFVLSRYYVFAPPHAARD